MMRARAMPVAVIFLFSALSLGFAEDIPAIPPEYPKIQSDDLPPGAAVLPLRIIQDRIFVPLVLNGKILCNAQIDTGSWITLVNKSKLKLQAANYNITGTETLDLPYVGGLGAQHVTFNKVALGSRVTDKTTIALINQEPGQPLSELEGLLGMDVLGQSRFTLDFEHQRLILWPANSKLLQPAAGIERVTLPLLKGKDPQDVHLYVSVLINGKIRANFCLDTGAFDPTLFTQGKLEDYGFDLKKFGEGDITNRRLGFTDGSFEFPCVQTSFPSLALETMIFKDVSGKVFDSASLSDARLRGFLKNCGNLMGTTFFKQLSALHIDVPDKVVYFERPKASK